MRISDWSSDVCSADLVVAGGPWRADATIVRGLASDPGMPVVPSPWRLYRHAWASPALSSVSMVPYWSPITYDQSDDTIGWNGPPPDPMRSEERRGRQEGAITGRSRGYPNHKKK